MEENMVMSVHRFDGLESKDEVLGPAEEEMRALWRRNARNLIPKRLRKIKKGVRLQNIRSQHIGIAQDRIEPNNPYIEVISIQKSRKRQLWWHVDNVRILDKKKKRKK